MHRNTKNMESKLKELLETNADANMLEVTDSFRLYYFTSMVYIDKVVNNIQKPYHSLIKDRSDKNTQYPGKWT